LIVNDIHFFDAIAIQTPREKIYAQLGYRNDKTRLDVRRRQSIDEWIDEALRDISLRGAAIRIPIRAVKADAVDLGAAGMLKGRHVAAWMKGCEEILCMAATAGERIMAAIRADVADGRLTRGVVFDATASEVTDEALTWISGIYRSELRRQSRCLTKHRYSAGYGDFGLEHQTLFYRLLRLDRLGVSLTGSFMLIPEKSVTAIAGIKAIGDLEREE
jgi:hypothetical protein